MTSLKTPLRYPGGKSRAIKKMAPYLPDMKEYKEYREPFLGGGSFAIWMTQTYPHLDIWVNDMYPPLVNFWKTPSYNTTTQFYTFGGDSDPDKLRERHSKSKPARL